MASKEGKRSRAGGLIVGAVLLLIAMVAVYSARHPSERSQRSAIERQQPRPVLDEQKRLEAAQVTACAAIQRAVEANLVFDRAFAVTPQDDGTTRLATAALLNGRRADVTALLRWDEERQEWDLLEASVGGATVVVDQ